MAQQLNKKVFYMTIMTKSGTILTFQTKLDYIIQSHASARQDEKVKLYYQERRGGLLTLCHRDGHPTGDHKQATGWIIDAGWINVQAYLDEARS